MLEQAPVPYAMAILDVSGQALSDMISRDLDMDSEIFWISKGTTIVPKSEALLSERGFRPGDTIVIQGRLLGGAAPYIQRSLDYFRSQGAPDDPPFELTTKHDLRVLCWNSTSLSPFTQKARLQNLALLLDAELADICLLQEVRFGTIHVPTFETAEYSYSKSLAGATCLIRSGLAWSKHSRFSKALSDIPYVEATVVQIRGSRSTLLIGSVYVHPNPAEGSIKALLQFSETHRIIIAGDFNAKGLIHFQEDCSNAAGHEFDSFMKDNDKSLALFPEPPTFIRHLDDGKMSSSILDGVLLPAEDYWTSLDDPIFQLDGDHLPICFTITPKDSFPFSRPAPPPPKFHPTQINSHQFRTLLQPPHPSTTCSTPFPMPS